MAESSRPSPDVIKTPESREVLSYRADKVVGQRVLLEVSKKVSGSTTEFVDPNVQVKSTDVKDEKAFGIVSRDNIFDNLEQSDNTVVDQASNRQRMKEAKVERSKLEQEYQIRAKEFHHILTGRYEGNDGQPPLQYSHDWNEFFSTYLKVATGKTQDSITSQDLYILLRHQYFTGDDAQSQTKAFEEHILRMYTTTQRVEDAKSSKTQMTKTVVDRERLVKDLDKIQHIATLFGSDGINEIITHLLDERTEAFTNPDTYVETASKEQPLDKGEMKLIVNDIRDIRGVKDAQGRPRLSDAQKLTKLSGKEFKPQTIQTQQEKTKTEPQQPKPDTLSTIAGWDVADTSHEDIQEVEDPKITAAKQEIIEKAGKRSAEETSKLIGKVKDRLNQEKLDGKDKLQPTIEQMRQSGVKELIHDHDIIYIPQEKGRLIIVGDLHGDSLTVEEALKKSKFIENMETGDGQDTIVFMGDYIDRGPQQARVLEMLLALKERYPTKVHLMKADHEVDPNVHRDFPQQVIDHYYNKSYSNIQGGQFLENFLTQQTVPQDIVNLIPQDVLFDFIRRLAKNEGNIRDKDINKKEYEALLQNIPITEQGKIRTYIRQLMITLDETVPLVKDDYQELFNLFPTLVIGGNGVIITHAGIPLHYDKFDLTTLKNNQDALKQMRWSDPGSSKNIQTIISGGKTLMMGLPFTDGNYQYTENGQTYFFPAGISVNNSRLPPNLIVGSGYVDTSNPTQMLDINRQIKKAVDATGGFLFNEDALRSFVAKIGGNIPAVVIRGHEKPGDATNFPGFLYTIHTSGGKSTESIYQGGLSEYAIFDKSVAVDKIEPHNIVELWK